MSSKKVMKRRVFHTLRSRAYQPPKVESPDLVLVQGILSVVDGVLATTACQEEPADLIDCGTPVALTMATP